MNLPERKRQNGVYWVKRKDIHLWIMASYEFGWWKLFGIEDNYNDDQIILTKYILSLNNKNEVYIDKNKYFFHVGCKPLQQITVPNSNVCFVHAAFNGLMDKFLLEHHNIDITMKDK